MNDIYKYGKHPPDLFFEVNWRRTRVRPGDYILLDNWIIAKVRFDKGTVLNLVNNCKIMRRWLYAFYTKDNLYQTRNLRHQKEFNAEYARRMLWGKKSPCVIEVLLLDAFMKTLDLKKVVDAVWGTLPCNRWFKPQIVRYLNYTIVKDLLMSELKKAFKDAQIEGAKLLKRMVSTGDNVNKRLTELIRNGEGSAKDITELSKTIFEMDAKLVDLWIHSEEELGSGVYEGSPTYLEPTNYKLIEEDNAKSNNK